MMRKLPARLAAAAGVCAALCASCTTQLAGGTNTGNGHEDEVVGTLYAYAPSGVHSAFGATVSMRPAGSLADTSGALPVDVASVKTAADGRYAINGVDTGLYVIEAADSANNRALISPVRIVRTDTTTALGPDTLKPSGAIKGKIILSEGGDPRKVLLLAFGLDRFARVDSNGSFAFPDLAQGAYTLRFLPLLADYSVLDTSGIAVKASDTTRLDSIVLPFSGIPTPKNVTISYDTLRQIVTLSWSKADTSLASSYNVYRRDIDSNTVAARINVSPVTDTVYRDSTAAQNMTYAYAVAAVNRRATEGTQSASLTVVVASAFRFIKDFGTAGAGPGQFLLPQDIAADPSGTFWVADANRNKILRFDSSGAFLSEWGVQGTAAGQLTAPFGLDMDPQQNIVVCGLDGTRVEKFDTRGNLILEIDSSGVQIKDVSVDENGNIYVSMAAGTGQNSIVKYDATGVLLASWQTGSVYISHALLARKGRVYCAVSQPSSVGHPYDDVYIEAFDSTGFRLGTITVRQSGETGVIDIRDLDVDGAGRVYAVDPEYGRVRIFNPDFTPLTSFGVKGSGAGQFSCIQGIAISAGGRIAVTDQSSIHLFVCP